MNKVLVAASALMFALGASPTYAQTSPREDAAYEYGFEWGFLAATCWYYHKGSLSQKALFAAFESIKTDKDTSKELKASLFRNVHKSAQASSQYFKPCSDQLKIYQRQYLSNKT